TVARRRPRRPRCTSSTSTPTSAPTPTPTSAPTPTPTATRDALIAGKWLSCNAGDARARTYAGGMADDRPARPDPLHWLWYALGGGLPPRYRDWVHHDATAPTWRLRQLVRSLVQALP